MPREYAGFRLDQALAKLLPDYSRSRLQQWIKAGQVRLDQQCVDGKHKVWGGEFVEIQPQPQPQQRAFTPENIPLNVVYEDESLLVINKPAGLVVHPANGNWSGTLLNGLLHYAPELAKIPRAGIVHRLDKDTSGLLVVARTLTAQTELVRQLQARTVKREYCAIARGVVPFDGTVNAAIGRHPTQRTKMAVLPEGGGKPAVTHYRVVQTFRHHTHLECQLETGRTHQIRVHLQAIGYPLLGDPVYGLSYGRQVSKIHFPRQALHAQRLGLMHPAHGEWMRWTASLPDDLEGLLARLENEDA